MSPDESLILKFCSTFCAIMGCFFTRVAFCDIYNRFSMLKWSFSFILTCKCIPLFFCKWSDGPPDGGLKLSEQHFGCSNKWVLKEIRRTGEAEHPCGAPDSCVRPDLMQRADLKWGGRGSERLEEDSEVWRGLLLTHYIHFIMRQHI